MPKIAKIKTPEGLFDAIEQPFEVSREEWNEYRLLDGGIVRMRITVQKIFRVLDDDGKPAFTPEGDPYILVRHGVQLVSSE